MNTLVDKLTKLQNRAPAIEGLTRDLLNLEANFFSKVAAAGAGQRETTNFRVEVWMKLVRDLVFNIEDWVDQNPNMTNKKLVEEDWVVPNFTAQIEHLCELCERYDLRLEVPVDQLHDPAAVVVPSQGTAYSRILFGEQTVLVGEKRPADELVKLLTGRNEKKLRVVSILGVEGLGKTTLAEEVYARFQLEGQFDCCAYVSVGKRPSIRNTLMEILRQLKLPEKEWAKPKPNPVYATKDLHTLVSQLWEYLRPKRYFILVDGLRTERAWRLINCALPGGDHGSRVLTTTSMSDVAKFCSVFPTDIYHMEALDEKMSTSLYLKTIGQRERLADCDEATKNMLKMCGGMPLAITVTAGLLATESEKVLLPSVQQYSRSEAMMNILQISYAALSLPMQSCLLYLSVFRENYIIKKDRLVRLWIAEGFIPREDKERRGEESLLETGERYFNQLIMRRLIQPVFNYNDDQAVGCTVHGAILDFVKSLSTKGNFVAVDGAHLRTEFARRFSLDCYDDQDEDGDGNLDSIAMHLFRVRSITVLGDIKGMDGRSALTESREIPILPRFKLLRVLDLEGTVSVGSHHLKGIGGLVLLKYLGVAGTDIDKLPKEIGKLEQLETLDVRHTKVSTLPASIAQKRLAHLLIEPSVRLPSEILKMQGLEEVSTIGVDSRSSVDTAVDLLRNSEHLSVLSLKLSVVRNSLGPAVLFAQVARCTKLRFLSLDCIHVDWIASLLEFASRDQLRRFELKIHAPIPRAREVYMASLVSVTHMDIKIIELDDQVVRVLGKLPNLVLLKLESSESMIKWSKTSSRFSVGADHGFKRLKVLSLKCHFGGRELEFTPGAMMELQRLSLSFSARETLSLYGNFSFGIEHLSSLTRVHAAIDCQSAMASEVKNAEAAMRLQVANLCSRNLTIEFTTNAAASDAIREEAVRKKK
ncbi:unnamed protein product [Alopecurus aequalis]